MYDIKKIKSKILKIKQHWAFIRVTVSCSIILCNTILVRMLYFDLSSSIYCFIACLTCSASICLRHYLMGSSGILISKQWFKKITLLILIALPLAFIVRYYGPCLYSVICSSIYFGLLVGITLDTLITLYTYSTQVGYNFHINFYIVIYRQYMNLSLILFLIGILGFVLNRKNIILMLISIEIMLLSITFLILVSSLSFDDILGQVYAIYVISIAGAESAIGLGILVAFYRLRGTIAISYK